MSTEYLRLDLEAGRALALLRNGEKRLRYGLVNALNATAKDIQKVEREHVASAFTLRKRDFVLRQAAIIKFASVGKDRYEAEVRVGAKPRLLLASFERGAERRPMKGSKTAVPIVGGPARPTWQSSVPAAFTFQQLNLRPVSRGRQLRRRRRTDVDFRVHTTSGGRRQLKGAHRTFVLTYTGQAHQGGVFQRVGPGRDDIRLVYSFKQHQKPIDTRLRFIVTGVQVGLPSFRRHMAGQVREAFARQLGVA